MNSIQTTDGVRICFEEVGTGPPLVLLPGINVDHTVWAPAVARLQDEFRVIAIDLRGHGASDKPAGDYSYSRLAADVGAVLAELKVEEEIVLAGWSFGGAVALRYALDAPTPPRGLALVGAAVPKMVAGPTWPRGVSPEDAAAAIERELSVEWPSARRAVFERMFFEPANDETIDWLWSASIKTPPWAAAACRRTLYGADFRPELSSLRVRTLILHGDADPIIPLASAEATHQGILGSRFVALEGCGHAPHLERPQDFNELMAEFTRDVHTALK
jgi:pimeloyl-ACP methyl ester carboxylesterase